jgi:hypothetical protein
MQGVTPGSIYPPMRPLKGRVEASGDSPLGGNRTLLMDRTQLEKYLASSGPTLEGQPITFLAGYTPFEVLEGENVLGRL